MPKIPGCPICGSSVKNWRTSSHQASQLHQRALLQQGHLSGQYEGQNNLGGYGYEEEQEPMPYMPKTKVSWAKKKTTKRPLKQRYQQPQFQDEDEAEYSSSGSDDGYEDA